MKIKSGTVKRIIVHRHNLLANRKDPGKNLPVLSVQTSSGPIHGQSIRINGPSMMVYRPDRPLSCGARIFLETTAEVEVNK